MDYSELAYPKPVKRKKKRSGFSTPANEYCQYCGRWGQTDRHHIDYCGMGGRLDPEYHTEANRIDLCRACHRLVHDGKITKQQLKEAKRECERWEGVIKKIAPQS